MCNFLYFLVQKGAKKTKQKETKIRDWNCSKETPTASTRRSLKRPDEERSKQDQEEEEESLSFAKKSSQAFP